MRRLLAAVEEAEGPVSYRVAFRKREGSPLVRAPRATAALPEASAETTATAPPVESSPTARLLALAY